MPDTVSNPLIDSLNPMQKEAVLHQEGPLLILAGAGSGKTRVITHRIAHLIKDSGVWPSEILAITFTNKAAREMQERVERLLGDVGRGMWIGTFHSMFLRILRRHAELLGFARNFSIMDPSEVESMLKEELKKLNLSEKHFPPRQILNQIAYAKSRMMTAEELYQEGEATYHPVKQKAAELLRILAQRMQHENLMDFDDILNYSVKLFDDFPEVKKAYKERFRYILVDEYQDTNRAQYLLIRHLAGPNGNVCVVGDDDQSIYAFRGADLSNILDFENDYPEAKVIKLEQNYRSTDKILTAANTVIAQNLARKDKRLWTDNTAGERLVVYRAEDQHEESRYIAREAKRLVDMGYKPGEIAILYRVNALSRNVEFALREQGLPYHIYGGLGFFERAEIKAAMAYVRFILDSRDPQALRRILQNPRRGIGDISFERLVAAADQSDGDLFKVMMRAETIPGLSRVKTNLSELVTAIQSLREQLTADLTFHQWFKNVLLESGLFNHYRKEAMAGSEEARSREENLQELISDALEFEAQQKAEWRELLTYEETLKELDPSALSLEELAARRATEPALEDLARAFVERAALYTTLDEEAEESLTLLTAHAAKGLEFDVVFVCGLEESLFPSYRAMDDVTATEEERRLAYVAITRARKRLYLTSARNRLIYGQTRYNLPSRFIKELPDDCVVYLGAPPEDRDREQRSVQVDPFDLGEKRREHFAFGRRRDKQEAKAKNEGIPWQSLEKNKMYRHPQHGVGTLVELLELGEDAIITMDFPDKTRRFMANLVHLEQADE